MSEPAPAIDTSLFDPEVSASDDFYRHVNAGWLDANPVPPQYGSWGAFHEVNDRNQELLHRLFDEAAGSPQAEDLATRTASRLSAFLPAPRALPLCPASP